MAEERHRQGQHPLRVGLQEGGLRERHRRLRTTGGLQATSVERSGEAFTHYGSYGTGYKGQQLMEQ